jgi:DNA-binding IclR family transcriptional regulator
VQDALIEKAPAAAPDGVAAVSRAFTILMAVADETGSSTLAELSRATGLHKSTILRLLGTLESGGFVSRLHDGSYLLGPSAFRLGLAYEQQNPLQRQVIPVLRDLVEAGTESASFHVRHGPNTRICLFRVNSRHSTVDRLEPGTILPLDRGAPGKVLLAFDSKRPAEFEAIRAAGYAVSRGERDPSCAAVAAPVFGPDGRIAGAISLSGPGERFSDEAVERMRRILIPTAAGLSDTLGGRSARR